METGNNKKPLPGKVEFTGERLFGIIYRKDAVSL